MSVAEDVPLVSERVYRTVSNHLFREAQLLDNGRLAEWLDTVAVDVIYRLVAPTLSMSGPASSSKSEEVALLDETWGSLKSRIRLLSTPAYTIADNPRSFTRRSVSNILVGPADSDETIGVQSNVLIYRTRSTQMEPHLFSMSRNDVFRWQDEKLLLLRRDAMLDEAVVTARNIAVLF